MERRPRRSLRNPYGDLARMALIWSLDDFHDKVRPVDQLEPDICCCVFPPLRAHEAEAGLVQGTYLDVHEAIRSETLHPPDRLDYRICTGPNV